jgi:hypothetical protein
MPDFQTGFDMGGALIPWGTTLSVMLARYTPFENDNRSAKFLIPELFGISILSLTVRAPALDRPVLQAWYEIKYDPDSASDTDIVNRVASIVGAPAAQTRYSGNANTSNPASSVRYIAHWYYDGVHVGMSIFGAPRNAPEGISSAIIYADWDDEIAAAAPYLKELEQADACIDVYARQAVILGVVALEIDQNRFFIPNYRNEDPFQALTNESILKAQRSLWKRHLRCPPNAISGTLERNQVAVWRNDDHRVWGISTKWDTVCFALSSQPAVSCANILPAKGSGGTYLTIADLSLASISYSSAIAEVTAILRDHDLATISFAEGYDE